VIQPFENREPDRYDADCQQDDVNDLAYADGVRSKPSHKHARHDRQRFGGDDRLQLCAHLGA
jgi:hypothetical protein